MSKYWRPLSNVEENKGNNVYFDSFYIYILLGNTSEWYMYCLGIEIWKYLGLNVLKNVNCEEFGDDWLRCNNCILLRPIDNVPNSTQLHWDC